MTKSIYTRRQMLQLSATAGTAFTLPALATAQAPQSATSPNLYAQLLLTWCDGLLAHQSTNPDPALRGALLSPASKFLDTFIPIETGNINYPVTSSHCFALCAQVLGDHHYNDRARQMAHASLDYFTPNNLLFGEGHPQTAITAKHCRPVDLG